MAPRKSEPQIPLKYAELMFVAFSSLVDRLSADDYPVDTLRAVLQAYDSRRTRHLVGRGMSNTEIRAYTAAAVDALTEWLDERAAKEEDIEHHFELWTQEMLKSDDRDA